MLRPSWTGNNDGIGDCVGLAQRLDYLVDIGDIVDVVRIARDRGMRVIADLVIDHTSDKHPWFISARSSKDSGYRH